MMRTTLSLDDDVTALLERVRKRKRLGLKEAVNEALRRGLVLLDAPGVPPPPFRTPSVDLGRCSFPDLDDAAEVLAIAEGDSFK